MQREARRESAGDSPGKAVADALLIDLDGVIYQGGVIVPGALGALDWLREAGIPYLFVTNTTSRSRADLLDKFAALGFATRRRRPAA